MGKARLHRHRECQWWKDHQSCCRRDLPCSSTVLTARATRARTSAGATAATASATNPRSASAALDVNQMRGLIIAATRVLKLRGYEPGWSVVITSSEADRCR